MHMMLFLNQDFSNIFLKIPALNNILNNIKYILNTLNLNDIFF
jgi:hypothetical protein